MNPDLPGVYQLTFDYTDAAGNAGEGNVRTVTISNRDPSDVVEQSHDRGKPATRHLGWQFGCDGIDYPNGGQPFQFFIVGDSEDAGRFTIDDFGNLRTAAILDFEYLEEHALTIRVEDPYGGSLEQEFVIEVVDAFSPIVESVVPEVGVVGLVSLSGRVLERGGIPEFQETGFLSRSVIRDSMIRGRTAQAPLHENEISFTFQPKRKVEPTM